MTIFGHDLAGGIDQGIAAAAGLGTLAAIAAPLANCITEITLPRITNTQCSMDKRFQFDTGYGAHGLDLLEGQLACQNGPPKAYFFKKSYPFRGVVVHLGAGKERQGWQIAFEQTDILNDQGIHTCLIELVCQSYGLIKFIIVEQRIDDSINPGPVFV